MGERSVRTLYDHNRTAWRAEGPRPVRIHVWEPVPDASRPIPAVVLSHGSGGQADDLAWLAEDLTARGFLAAAVEHHGNNALDEPLLEGFTFWWERPADLGIALDHLARTYPIGPAAAVGYSLGGYTAAALLGARIDPGKYRRLSAGEPILPVPPQLPDIAAQMAALAEHYGADALFHRAIADHRDSRFSAAALLAPAICPILQDSSLIGIDRPVFIRWGDADDVEPAETNGRRYAQLIPGADAHSAGATVGHFDIVEDGEVRASIAVQAGEFLARVLLGNGPVGDTGFEPVTSRV